MKHLAVYALTSYITSSHINKRCYTTNNPSNTEKSSSQENRNKQISIQLIITVLENTGTAGRSTALITFKNRSETDHLTTAKRASVKVK